MTIELTNLYKNIYDCHICPEMDNTKAMRNVKAVTKNTKVFIISQALAEKQLRYSGVNFFNLEGHLGSTGKRLEKFLNLFGQTVYPPIEIKLNSGNIIPKCKNGFIPVYNTEIAQCFPGKNQSKNGDREPSKEEIKNCLSQNFVFDEINYIKPKLLLLMGRSGIDSFYRYVIKKPENKSTETLIENIVKNKKIPNFKLNGYGIYVLPIQHASGGNRHYLSMLSNNQLIQLIKEVINE